ncbi:MAG: TIM-barrel domain-containing protein [Bacteroidota bacterium]
MRALVTGLLMVVCSLTGFTQGRISVQLGDLKKSGIEGNGVVLTTREAQMRLSAYGPDIIRVRVTREKPAADFSYAVIGKPDGKLGKISENDQAIVYSTGKVSVTVNKSPLRLKFTDGSGRVISEDDPALGVSWMGNEVTSYRRLFPDERFIGLGEKTGGLNRRGSSYVNWNSDVPAYALDKDPLYSTIPFFIGMHDKLVYGIFLDNSYKTFFDFGASTDGRMSSFGAPDGELNYYLISGETVADIIRNYTGLTGRAQLPPLWSFGYQQCRWSYYPDKELLTIAKTFRDKQIPIDVLYLDIHYMDNYKIFTFSPENYPNPKETIAELKNMGFKVVVIIDPGLKIESGYSAYEEGVKNNYFIKYPDGTDYTGSVWPGPSHFPDFTNPLVRDWWGGLFKVYTDAGIDGYWNDMNEPAAWGQNIPDLVQFDFDGHNTTMSQAHNVYGMQMVRSTYDGIRKLNPDKRPLTITRATYAGGQRYSTIWTGDNASYDDHMLLGTRLVNSLGVSGFPFAGPDVGGFVGEPSPDLIMRWLSIGIYTPFLRNHVDYNHNYREPWIYGKENEKIARELINQRYRLLPYIYSAAYEATQTGLPVSRTLAIDYSFDDQIYRPEFENEYLFGDGLLVAPVVSTQKFTKVYLPAAGWYRLSTDAYFEGGKEILAEAPIDDLPVFAKAGAIIPMQSVIQNTTMKPDETMLLHIYYGKHPTTFTYYVDDGVSFEYERGVYFKRQISFNPSKNEISIGEKEGSMTGKFTKVKLILHGFPAINEIKVNGTGAGVNKESEKVQSVTFGRSDKETVIIW